MFNHRCTPMNTDKRMISLLLSVFIGVYRWQILSFLLPPNL